jgi:hypothetical protein
MGRSWDDHGFSHGKNHDFNTSISYLMGYHDFMGIYQGDLPRGYPEFCLANKFRLWIRD